MGRYSYSTRVLLIRLGKNLPFVICLIVFISYAESLWSLMNHNYLYYEDSVVLSKPVSWFIAQYFEYNLVTVVILLTISVAVETCIWNKLTILYLSVQLTEKNYISEVELYPETVYVIVVVNLLICGYLLWKGVRVWLK